MAYTRLLLLWKFLQGKTLAWASAVGESQPAIWQNYEIFDHPVQSKEEAK